MKLQHIKNKFLLPGVLVCVGVMSSCDDFLTVLPTGQITEEHFWQDRNDLENVRAGAYKKFIDQTSSIFYWGELRSDNVKLKDQSNTTLLYMQQAILRPSNNNYSWANFYTGINYCNKVIEYGDNMTNEPLVDPSFGKSDYRPIEAEMKALRALYYFYLVRAFRDVPYVTNSVSTDKEAKEAYYYPSSGEAILGEMIRQLEEVKDYGTINYGSNSENHGRFTKRSIYALLADLYLWRGCMLKNYSKKFDVSGNLRAVNLNDVVNLNADGDTIGYTTVDSVAVNDEYCNSKATECFQKAAERAQFVIDELNKDRKENMEISRSLYNTYEQEDIYPLTHCNFKVGQNVQNKVYSTIWGNNNSSESIFELQFDGTQNSCGTYASYMSSYASNSVSIGSIIANDILTTGIGQDRPTQGFGKKDLRLLETIGYTDEFISASTLPIVKNVIREFNVADLENMAEGYAGDPDYRVSTNMNANWPIYRLSDMMMIKAEAYARLGTNLNEGYMLYNHLYNRNNPNLNDSVAVSTATDLLTRVYMERQREFVGEGKRWFDIVRQAEAGDYYSGATTSIMEDLGAFISSTNTVKNRMRNLWSFYCPIVQKEIDVQGIEAGGHIIQNPVWDRYTEKK